MWPPSSWYCIKLVIGTSGTNYPFAFPKFFAIPSIQIYKTWNFNLIFLIKKIKKIKKWCITSGRIFKSWRENMGQINRGMVFRSLYYPHIFEHYYYWNKYAITLAPVGTCESIDLTHCSIRRSHKLICSKYQSHGNFVHSLRLLLLIHFSREGKNAWKYYKRRSFCLTNTRNGIWPIGFPTYI